MNWRGLAKWTSSSKWTSADSYNLTFYLQKRLPFYRVKWMKGLIFDTAWKWTNTLTDRLYESSWFTFGWSRWSKNEPGLKIFFTFHYATMYSVYKRTDSGSKILQASFRFATFGMFYIRIYFIQYWSVPNCCDLWVTQVNWWGLAKWTSSSMWASPESYNFIYSGVYFIYSEPLPLI